MPYGIIYKIQFPSGKNYIGLTTTSLEQRKREHKCRAKNKDNTNLLYKSLRKYDIVDTFELIEIDTADTFDELCEKEIKYIQEYNSHYLDGNGYNMTYGGDGINGYVRTEEDNIRHGDAMKEYYLKNPEARKQMSEKLKEYYLKNTEARQKCSEAQQKRFSKPEEIQKSSEAQQKRFSKPEEIQKSSEAMKKYYEDNPVAREVMSEIKNEYYLNNPDSRKKILDGRGQNKPFDVFKCDGTFIKTFTYQFEAREYLQKEYNITSHIYICDVLQGNKNLLLDLYSNISNKMCV